MSLPPQGAGGGGVSKQDITTANGTYSHPSGTSEQDVLEFLDNDENIEVTFDMTLLTQDTTVRVKNKTDGITYRLVKSAIYPTNFDGANVVITLNGKARDMKITFQSAIAEGAIRAIPHSRVEVLRV